MNLWFAIDASDPYKCVAKLLGLREYVKELVHDLISHVCPMLDLYEDA